MFHMKQNTHFLVFLLLTYTILNITACGLNKRLNKVSEYRFDDPQSIVIRDDHAYILNGHKGFWILDVSNTLSPEIIGQCPIAEFSDYITVSGNYAYIVDQKNGLLIFDISNPSDPELISIYSKSGNMVSVQGNYAYYIVDRSSAIEVLDISKPSNPQSVGIYDVNKLGDGSSINYVLTENNFAYISVSQSGVKELRILDISDPTNLIELSSLDIITPFYDSVRKDNYLYLAHGNKFTIVDVKNPKAPEIVSTINDSFFLGSVDILKRK